MLPLNTLAPDFTLKNQDGKDVTISSFKGKTNVVLIFYPFDFSPVCSDEIALFNQAKPLFDKRETTLFGLSVDSMFCHKQFATERKIGFDLLSDFEPKGAVSKLYQSYNDKVGCSERSLYLIGKDGNIHYAYLSPMDKNPGADGVLEAIDNLTKNQ